MLIPGGDVDLSRRQLMRTASAGLVATVGAKALRAQGLSRPKALVFDTFGTLVDWRGSIIAEGVAWEKSKGLTIDWADFADRWRVRLRAGDG